MIDQIEKPLALAKRTSSSSPSKIREIFRQVPQVAKKRVQDGLPPLINLSIGEPHLPENPVMHVKKETSPFPGGFGYSAAEGREETLEAIVDLYKTYYPTAAFTKNEVMVTLGATGALAHAFAVLINPGDKVITFTPFFSLYESQVNNLGGEAIKISTQETHFKPNLKLLEQAIQTHPTTKAIVLNYPNNPTGVGLDPEETKALAALLKKYPALHIIIDDVYRDLSAKEHTTVLDFEPELKNRCIVINSGSKGLAGSPARRIGTVGAREELIKAMTQQQNISLTSVPDETQIALIRAIEERLHPKTNWLKNAQKIYRENSQFVLKKLQQLNMAPVSKPEGGFFVMMDAKKLIGKKIPEKITLMDGDNTSITIEDVHTKIGCDHFRSDIDIVQYFLQVMGVAMVPGCGFGISPEEGQIRISCAKDMPSLQDAMQRIEKGVNAILIHAYAEAKERGNFDASSSFFAPPKGMARTGENAGHAILQSRL